MNIPQGEIVLLGSSGHAAVIADIVAREGRWHLSGVLDPERPRGSMWNGLEILGGDGDIGALMASRGIVGGIVAIGDNALRERVTRRIAAECPQFQFVTAVHPAAAVASSVSIGAGSVVMAGAVVNPGSTVGCGCIVNTRSSLDHDSVMEDFASLAPGATTGGRVRIGRGSAIGLGALLREAVVVAESTVVGAGALVLSDLPSSVVAYGVPARVIRSRKPGDKYMR